MNIGIKFCGGCNPKYNRRKLIGKLEYRYAELSFEPAKENYYYDIIVIVNGCLSSCSDYDNLKSNRLVVYNSDCDFYNLKIILDALSIKTKQADA